MKVLFW